MKHAFLLFLTLSFLLYSENIYVINSLKEKAEQNHKNGNLKKALIYYKELVEIQKNKEGTILINYAELLLMTKDTLTSRGIYSKVITFSKNNIIKSRAYTQSAIIEYKFNKNKDEALLLLQKALIEDDQNIIARKNLYYILLLKSENIKESESQTRPSKSPNQRQSNGSSTNNEIETNSMKIDNDISNNQINAEEFETSNFENLNISKEKAIQLLEAMQKNEVQYIQQLKRREEEIETESNDRPDW